MEKMNNEIFMQSPGRRYLVMQGKAVQQAAAQNNHQYQWEDPFHATEQEKGCSIGRKQESIFESGEWTYISCNRALNRRNTKISEAQIFCFAGLYTGASDGLRRAPRDQVEASYFLFYFWCCSQENRRLNHISAQIPQKNQFKVASFDFSKTIFLEASIRACDLVLKSF